MLSCHGDIVGLHIMRMGTLHQVRLRETHYLMQPFLLSRRICGRSCHATGQSILTQGRMLAGHRGQWEGAEQEKRGGREEDMDIKRGGE